MTKIHPTALIDKKARIGEGAEIGPYSVIGPDVTIGAGTRILSHVVIEGAAEIGERNVIHHGACIGTPSQDMKTQAVRSSLKVGSDNIIREYVTINLGSGESTKTIVGDWNFLMIGAHVGHDCTLGDHVTIANNCLLGGHVTVEDNAVLGGLSGVHQFVRIGKFAMIGGKTRIVMDVPPFSLCNGNPAKFYGINTVGLRRGGFTPEERLALKKAFKVLSQRGRSQADALAELRNEFKNNLPIQHLVSFIEKSKRGVMRGFTDKEVEYVLE
ncbi:MAG: acyl-ACP--UDP-N-acetylglucosamine O-acyltransferase [Candidatus Omnitrophota bacterium]